MTERVERRPEIRRRLSLGVIASVVFAVPTAIGQGNTTQSAATPLAAAVPVMAPVFEVASIRENKSVGGRSHIVSSAHDGHFVTINVRGISILQFAFDMPQTRIIGAPSWLNSEKFDIEAKADSLDDPLSKLTSDEGKLQKRKMLQALLAERFQLKVHQETRELPIYAMVVAKSGPRFQETKAGNLINHGNGYISITSGDAINVLAEELAEDLGRVVVDRTGITGRYDIHLKWTPDDTAAPPSETSGPSIFTALQEQLGLKLESQKGPVQVSSSIM